MLAQAPAGRKRIILAIAGAALELWALAAVVQSPGADIPRHVFFTLAAWAVWVLAITVVPFLPTPGWRRDLVVIFAIGVAMRATLLATTPSLSDDAYRAVWDGRLVHAGVNPYAYAPDDSATEPYRDTVIWPNVNHKEQRTPYPPLAVLLQAGAYSVFPERLLGMQALAAVADLAAAALLALLLRRFGLDARRCLVIAWSPIGAVHFAHSGHNDAVMVAAFLAATLLLTFGRRYTGFVALGLATAIKGIPALMVPAFARAGGWVALGFWAATCVLLTLPFIQAGLGLAAGAWSEGEQRFNDSAYLVVERIGDLIWPGQGSLLASVFAAIIVLGAAILSFARSDGTPRGSLVSGSWMLGVYLLVAPVVEPWYVTWLAPLIALHVQGLGRGNGVNAAWPWLWLTGAATLTELTYLEGTNGLWPLIRAIEYVPTYLLLGLVAWGWCMHRYPGLVPSSWRGRIRVGGE